jgi:hypothetical protein
MEPEYSDYEVNPPVKSKGMPPPERPDTTEVDSVLTYTQEKRLMVIEQLTKFGTLTTDPKEMSILLKSLDGMDKSVATRKRLIIDAAAQMSQEEEARHGAEILKAMRHGMFAIAAEMAVPRAAPDLASIPTAELVPGETEIGVAGLNYEAFMQGLPKQDESPTS